MTDLKKLMKVVTAEVCPESYLVDRSAKEMIELTPTFYM